MKTKKMRSKRLFRKDRGSALLVSLMVIVGLSLLGLGFVAVSETETAIARNQQNALQTQAIAEAGARLVVEWFQNPAWGEANAGMPGNTAASVNNIKTWRVIVDINDPTKTLTGYYKGDASVAAHLLDKPYRPHFYDRFYGDENTPDILINNATDALKGTTILKTFNTALLGANLTDKSFGEISEVRIYAPPTTGCTLTADVSGYNGGGGANKNIDGTTRKFWTGACVRYGVATIKVTAQQYRVTGDVTSGIVSTHSVRLVVGELPLPIPAGPIQGNANVQLGGAFKVHWGNETATGQLDPSANFTTIPWANAYERSHIEHGYEPGVGSGTATQQVWPTTGGSFDSADFYHEVLGKGFEDPWYGARSVGDNLVDGTNATGQNPQCFGVYDPNYDEQADPKGGGGAISWGFQWQDRNAYPNLKKVTFPVIKYDYWKRIAQQGRGYKGVYYFKYEGPGQFTKFGRGTADTMANWVNSRAGAGLGAGVFFFDTVDGSNPQSLSGVAKTAKLTDPERWNNKDFGGDFLMVGFIYMNAQVFGSTGAGNSQTTLQVNFPGEPFRDVGAPVLDSTKTPLNEWKLTNSGTIQTTGQGDGTFTCPDQNGNNKCDVVVIPAPAWTSHDPGVKNWAQGTGWVEKTWKQDAHNDPLYGADCTLPAANYDGTPATTRATDCSEPHEPFLNIIWPTDKSGDIAAADNCTVKNDCKSSNGSAPDILATIGFEDPSAQHYWTKTLGVACTSASKVADCTSNAYDIDGPLTPLQVILDGVLYNEGTYDTQGNSWYFGSVLIQGNVGGAGSANVWFDEKLIKGTWAPADMPRVVVFSEQTDEQQ